MHRDESLWYLMVWFRLCFLLSVLHSESLWLLHSTATPFNASQVVNLPVTKPFTITAVLITSPEQLPVEGVVLDYLYQQHLSVLAKRNRPPGKYWDMWTASPLYPQVFAAYLQAFNFTQLLLVSDTAQRGTAKQLYTSYPSLFRDWVVLANDVSTDQALYFVGRYVKPQGINLIALLMSAQATSHFLQALQDKKMLKAGYAYVLSQNAGRYRYASEAQPSGILVIGENCEAEASIEELEARRLSETLLGAGSPNYSLFYTVGRTLVKAAASPGELTSATTVLFPGNSTAFPKLSKAKIRTWVNYSINTPSGAPYPLAGQVMRGYEVAFEDVNSRTDLLPHYHLEDQAVDFNGVVLNYNRTYAAIATAFADPALIYMPIPISGAIVVTTQVLRDLNLSLPITSSTMDSKLSGPQTYPFFVRPRTSSKYVCMVVARMMRFFGWSNVAFLYALDGGDAEDVYTSFLEAAKVQAINVTNPEDLRALPSVLDSSTVDAVNTALQAILSSMTRIIMIVHNYHFQIMEQLYDLGVREGYVQVYITGLADAVFKDPKYYKRRVVSKGALQFSPRLFVGAVGAKVLQRLIEKDGSGIYPNGCIYYDSAFLYFHATEYLLSTGHDYESAVQITKAMRGTHFHGCSGFVTIESGSNDRAASEITITNLQYHAENDTADLKQVGAYNPFSSHPYQLTSPVQWPDDQPTYGDSKPFYPDCPYLAEEVRVILSGKLIGIVVSFAVALATLLVTVWIWRRWWRVRLVVLREKQPIMMEDVLVLITVGCDYFQLAAVGPDLTSISSLVTKLSASLGFDVQKLVTISHGVYWLVLNGTLGLVLLWTLISVLKFTHLHAKVAQKCSWFEYWTVLLMPALGNMLFLPIISTLTGVFLCYKSASDSLSDSFLNKDCTERCWQGSHTAYTVLSTAALLCYIPLAVFTRPLWQELQPNLHIKAQPSALMVKSTVQVFLIVASNTLKQEDPDTHAYLFFLILTLYLLFMLRFRQYNYDRLNLWQVLVTLAVLSLALFAHATSLSDGDLSNTFIIVLVAEYGLLAAVGVTLQLLLPIFGTRLTRAKSRDVRGLFTFGFTWGERAQAGLEHFYSANDLSPTKFKSSSVIQAASSQ